MHGRMPVEAAEEDWGQFPGRLRIPVALQDMGELVGIFTVEAIERQAREALIGLIPPTGDGRRDAGKLKDRKHEWFHAGMILQGALESTPQARWRNGRGVPRSGPRLFSYLRPIGYS